MGYTICYDTLVKKAKKKKFKSNAEPGQEDIELNKAIEAEKKKYDDESEQIYEREANIIEKKYKSEKTKIDTMAPIKEAEYKMDRFNSTDAAKYGDDNIKTSFSKEMNKLLQNDEYQKELENARGEQKLKEQNNEKTKKEKESESNVNNSKAKRKEKTEKIKESSSTNNDLVAYAGTIGKDVDKSLDELQSLYDSSLRTYEETVLGQAKENGEKTAEDMIKSYNDAIKKSAKDTFNTTMKNKVKAQITADVAIQKAKLKLSALLGL